MLHSVRRLVTAVNDQGRSCFAEVGASPAVQTVEERPGYANHNIWRTTSSPAKLHEPDSIVAHRGVVPPQGGTIVRIIDIPPEAKDPEERRRQSEMVFRKMFDDARRDHENARHPGMHTTDTIDYAIMIAGELVAVMDEGEEIMRPGDVLIQRGTAHAWRNCSDDIARIAFVLIDGQA